MNSDVPVLGFPQVVHARDVGEARRQRIATALTILTRFHLETHEVAVGRYRPGVVRFSGA